MRREALVAAAAPAAAILVFGVIYGSLAEPLLGAGPTILSSLLNFSGALQFTIAGMLAAGAGIGALLGAAVTLNLRHLLLGAVMRPRIRRGPLARAGLAWFLTDEAVGLALASRTEATRTLLVSGTTFYLSWQIGTVLGLLGASAEGVRTVAEAVFPVLFVGLAAVSCPSRSVAVRAVVAAAATGAALFLWPGSRGVAAVVAAIAVAIPGREP